MVQALAVFVRADRHGRGGPDPAVYGNSGVYGGDAGVAGAVMGLVAPYRRDRQSTCRLYQIAAPVAANGPNPLWARANPQTALRVPRHEADDDRLGRARLPAML